MFLNLLLRAVFPTSCVDCGKKTKNDLALCEKCLASIPLNYSLFCGRCHARLPANGRGLSDYKKICHLDVPFVLAAATNYRDNPSIQKIIRKFKFRHGDWLGETLGKLMCPYAKAVLPKEELLICPIPLGRRRLHERGFNQAEVLADIVARELRLPVTKNALTRTKETKAQTLVHEIRNRMNNLENAFLADTEKFLGKNILLIDDVTTTGATLYSASKTLKAAGAKKIYALVSAKAG